MSGASVAYVGLGGNVGGARATVTAAIAAIAGLPGTTLLRASRQYRTPAWGQEAQPDFINAVVAIRTALAPRALLEALLGIERRFGRDRDNEGARWGPRTLDLDLLLHDEACIDEPGLTVPHPHMHARAFVLVPLVEIAPDLEIPGRGRASAVLAGIATDGIEALP
jgi:2-amino-4-hydroxy-6-hydroxymethyldihydropteridine diphosphokinase